MPNHSGTTAQFVRSRCSIRYGVFNHVVDDVEKYFIQYKLVTGISKKIEISLATFTLYNKEFKKPIENIRIEKIRKIDKTSVEMLLDNDNDVFVGFEPSCESAVISRIELEEVIRTVKTCTKTQQKRFYLRFFQELTFQEIATLEKCNISAVSKSIKTVLEKIQK